MEKLISMLVEKGLILFSSKDVEKLIGRSAKDLLSYLASKGYIERVEKGKYILNIRVLGLVSSSEFLYAQALVTPSAIAYATALSFHDLTEQLSRIVYVQTPKRKKKQEYRIHGVKYRIVRVKEEKFFGLESVWIDTPFGSFKGYVTDKEKTIVDCLDKPRYAGGIYEVVKALETRDYDTNKLREYAIKMKNSAVIRRLGYLCDVLGIDISLPFKKPRNYIVLDPTLPAKGRKDSKWRIIVNAEV